MITPVDYVNRNYQFNRTEGDRAKYPSSVLERLS